MWSDAAPKDEVHSTTQLNHRHPLAGEPRLSHRHLLSGQRQRPFQSTRFETDIGEPEQSRVPDRGT